jgi:hypothetical protein
MLPFSPAYPLGCQDSLFAQGRTISQTALSLRSETHRTDAYATSLTGAMLDSVCRILRDVLL